MEEYKLCDAAESCSSSFAPPTAARQMAFMAMPAVKTLTARVNFFVLLIVKYI